MVDIRSHILRGLDDGTETLEESVAMLKLMAESDIVATPHANSRYRFQTDVVTQRIAEVSEGLSGKPHIHCGGAIFTSASPWHAVGEPPVAPGTTRPISRPRRGNAGETVCSRVAAESSVSKIRRLLDQEVQEALIDLSDAMDS